MTGTELDFKNSITYDYFMFKNILKFLGIGVGIAVLGLGVVYGVQYFQYRNNPEYQAVQDLENLKKKYAQDPYGGDTPEQTLQLFVDALKKGDTDLAAKYFVLDKQQEWREELMKIKEKGLLKDMIKDIESTKLTFNETAAYFTLVRTNDLSSELVMHKNPLNKKWKITEL